jgi:hypothetical protein
LLSTPMAPMFILRLDKGASTRSRHSENFILEQPFLVFF